LADCYLFNVNQERVQDLGRQRTETKHHQLVGRSESHGYWVCCWRVASASTRLHSCCRQTFWTHAVIKMMWS